MAKEEKIFSKSTLFQIGLGILLYFLLRGGDVKHKTENKPVAVDGDNNEVTKGAKVEIHNPALIRVDPTISVTRWFKNSEYFGKQPREVSKETYANWGKLSKVLSYVRGVFGKPVLIVRGYLDYPKGDGAIIKAQNGDNWGLWNSINLFVETNKDMAKHFKRLSSKLIEVKI